MSIFWIKNKKLKDKILPYTLLRPFWHPEYITLNDSIYTTSLPSNKPQLLSLLLVATSLILLSFSIFNLYTYFEENNVITLTNKLIFTDNIREVILIIIAITLMLVAVKMLTTRTVSFKRSSHEINYPRKSLLPKYSCTNFDDFIGLIIHQKSITGRRRAQLILKHKESGDMIILATVNDNHQALAGYWSFIVQYMKPSAALPRVPALADYSRTTEGLIHEKTIDYS
jgi:hypothetical protein